MWADVLLGITVAALVSVAFVGGCFCGSWVQRSIGYVIRTRAEKELLDQAKEREEDNYTRRRQRDWQKRRKVNAEEAMEDLNHVPNDSPLGDPIPSPEDIDDILPRNPHDFTTRLATERLKEAHG